MAQLLVALGILIGLAGLAAVVRPRALIALAHRISVGVGLRVIAFVIRAALGGILILVSGSTAFPLTIRVIGALLILSGIFVLLLGNEGLQRFISRVLERGPVAVVTAGLIALALGGFLIYAAV